MTIEADVVIIGAGPCGLFQVFELGLLGLKAHVIETLEKPGGQCTELYPDKPIYDIPGLPAVGAQQLIDNLMIQIEPFAPEFHLGQQVLELSRRSDERFYLRTSKGVEFIARAVVIAAGVGSFEPVRLKVPGVERHVQRQIHYSVTDPAAFDGKDIVVLGGGDSALDWTLELYQRVNSLLLIHRSDRFKAAPASIQKMRALADNVELQFLTGNVVGLVESGEHLTNIEVASLDGITRRVELDQLLVFYGLSPKPGPILDWNLTLRKNQIVVDPEKFQSSTKGIYAVGDINWYPGKKKLILSGFHESALAAFAIKEQMNPGKKVALQYTTTSSVMHQRLGVDDPFDVDEVAA